MSFFGMLIILEARRFRRLRLCVHGVYMALVVDDKQERERVRQTPGQQNDVVS